MSKRRAFTSTIEVIEALGGSAAVAALTGRKTSAVSNWRQQDHFPANTYLILRQALETAECEAPDWLWDMAPRAHRKRRLKVAVAAEAI
jgi:hypothetical protein